MKRNQLGKNNPNYKNGNYCKGKICKDCERPIARDSIRCPSCAKKRKLHPNYRHGKTYNNRCINCNKLLGNYRSKRCKSCSRKGKLHVSWIEDRNLLEYPDEFNKYLKEQIRKRDNYICQNCGMTEEEHLMLIGTNLTIHHIDYNKKNCQGNNLISLCNQCNLRANINRDYWQELYQNKIKVLITEGV